jgi:hypothetical protein
MGFTTTSTTYRHYGKSDSFSVSQSGQKGAHTSANDSADEWKGAGTTAAERASEAFHPSAPDLK